jgi:hypothetical protein
MEAVTVRLYTEAIQLIQIYFVFGICITGYRVNFILACTD